MTSITLKHIEDTHFATVYYHDTWAGVVHLRVLSTDNQLRIMDGETITVEVVLKPEKKRS